MEQRAKPPHAPAFLTALCALAACTALHAQSGSWTPIADFGAGVRSGAVSFTIGSKAYVGTGESSGGSYKKDFWEYDPATDAWSQKADFGGSARRFAVGFSIGSKGYLGTGNASDGRKKDFWEYDPTTNQWTQKADCGGSVRVYAVGLSIAGKGYIGTGFNLFDEDSKDFWEYNPVNNTWTQKANFGGTPRDGAAAFAIGNKGYVGTGYDSLDVTGDFWEFDPVANTWLQKAAFGGGARYNACGFSLAGKGYMGTGNTGSSLKNDLWAYDPVADAWAPMAVFPGTARERSAAFSMGDTGYLGLGQGSGYRSDLWAFSTAATIQCTPDPGPHCVMAATELSVPFTSDGAFSAGNVFTAQLSDAIGSFAAPQDIGTWSGTTAGPIACTIPAGTAAGSGYRIRVNSSAPAITGNASSSDLVLEAALPAAATITADGPVQFCAGGSVGLSVVVPVGQSAQWYMGDDALPGSTGAQVLAASTGTYTVQLANGCGTSASNGIAVVAQPAPTAQITAQGDTIFCDGGSVLLDASVSDAGAVYAWYVGGDAIPGADSATLPVATSGQYTVVVTGGSGCASSPSAAVPVTVHALPAVPMVTAGGDSLVANGAGTFQWYVQGGPVPGATEYFIVPQVNGDYTVTVTDANGCSSTSAPYTYLTTGMAATVSAAVHVCPNPGTGLFTLHLPQQLAPGALYTVRNAAGQEVLHGQLSGPEHSVDLTCQPAGSYLLQVVSAAASWTGRLIKQ